MKLIMPLIFVVVFGVLFISAIINAPVSVDTFSYVWEIVWSALAITLGGFAAFYPKKFNDGNTRRFEKLYNKTKIAIFRYQAEETREPYMLPFARAMGILFITIGFVLLIRNLISLIV